MLNNKMAELGKKRSAIREIFEYAKVRKKEIGEENVFDFSLGNPSIPAPEKVNNCIVNLVKNKSSLDLHGYTSAQGDAGVRKAVADSIIKRFNCPANENLIYMTCGAAASLTISLNAVTNCGDEIIILAPFFPEYRVFTEKAGGKPVEVKCNENNFQIDFNLLENAITNKTKAVIVNSPNNPTGVVFSEDSIKKLSDLLNQKQKEYGNNIYIISDEPYRELIYGEIKVPYIPNYYDNTIVCYSFSKSLSISGERIGYIFVSPNSAECGDVYCAVCGAGRALGYVCAPSILQYTVSECLYDTSDIGVYAENCNILCNALTEYGYTFVKPDGAFYLFLKSLETNADAFCDKAKKYELLFVPSDSFGFDGYVRIAYCVSTEKIKNSLPAFKALIDEYKGK